MFFNIKYNTSTVSCTINSKWYLSIQAHKIQGSDRIFEFFPRKSTWISQIFMKNLDLFPWVKSWALDFSSNLNGNTNVCNNKETWRSMQLTNTIEQYTNFKQSSERKLLKWRTRTILIRQFKYCFSNL